MQPKRVLCMQDVSCVGRCSLAVILPALSAMGIQACPMPTALLATHPGGFAAPVRTDETDFLRNALAGFKQQALQFNAILSGFLASPAQAQLVQDALRQNPDALKIIDPVLADGGKLYSGSTPALCDALRALCCDADVLTPNVTESAVLLGLPPADAPMDDAALTARIAALHAAYPQARFIVLTGVQHVDGRCGNALLCAGNAESVGSAERKDSIKSVERVDAHTGTGTQTAAANTAPGQNHSFLPYESIPQSYPGTGDLFAALLTGALLTHGNAVRGVQDAAAFISAAARHTLQNGGEVRNGVQFEPLLYRLCKGL